MMSFLRPMNELDRQSNWQLLPGYGVWKQKIIHICKKDAGVDLWSNNEKRGTGEHRDVEQSAVEEVG